MNCCSRAWHSIRWSWVQLFRARRNAQASLRRAEQPSRAEAASARAAAAAPAPPLAGDDRCRFVSARSMGTTRKRRAQHSKAERDAAHTAACGPRFLRSG
eukprot:6197427-Pleurochrysis_carterae.AAC.5